MNTRRERNRVVQRTRILAAARERFSADGFDAVTMADVAETAGVARATVFNQFDSKGGLVAALIDDVQGIYSEMLGAALQEEETSTPTLIVALFEQMGIGIEADRSFYRGVFRGMAQAQIGLADESNHHSNEDRSDRRLTELIDKGRARGDLVSSQSTESLAAAITSLVNGTITRWLYDDATEPLVDRMRAAALVLLEPLGSPTATHDGPRPLLISAEILKGRES